MQSTNSSQHPNIEPTKTTNASITAMKAREVQDWTPQEVASFFTSLGLNEFVEQLLKYRVDGLLLLRMEREDWAELGIISQLQIKRIQLKLEQITCPDWSDRLLSSKQKVSFLGEDGTTMSDLSITGDYIDEIASAGEMSKTDCLVEESDSDNDEDKFDERYVSIEVIYSGEIGVKPEKGNVVQVHFSMSVVDGNELHLIEATRDRRGVPLEFVLGKGQVIKGVDAALKRFCRGERSIVKIQSECGYGVGGLPPRIPRNATLQFDLELINFWQRPNWFKPWIQKPGLSHKPYAPAPAPAKK